MIKQLVPKGGAAYLTEMRSRAIIAGHPETRKLTVKGFRFPVDDDAFHIALALTWFAWATSASADGGVPHSVNIRTFASRRPMAIAPSYPETSGYILCTMVYGMRSGLPSLPRERLDRLCTYLIASQAPSGDMPGPGDEKRCLAFDTGQALTGLTAYYRHVQSSDAVEGAIRRAADWMSAQVEPDGCYAETSCYRGQRAYYVQATIGLLHAAKCFDRRDWLDAAARNADWAWRRHRGNGWFDTISFEDDAQQNLHGIAYTLRGMIELGHRLGRAELVDAGRLAVERIMSRSYDDLPAPHSIPGHFADGFESYLPTISRPAWSRSQFAPTCSHASLARRDTPSSATD